ncbi:MAG TPA: hypothetical protein VK716_17810 [Terracidiphilus sp.]|jgi:hypothetical protein|nr:hypothetical protein [Terracidiphilus sp.]
MTQLEKEDLIKVLKAIEKKISVLEAAVRSHDHSQQQQPVSDLEHAEANSQPTIRRLIEGLEKTLKGQF